MASDNAASGGMLVILGIVVALIAVYFFSQHSGGFGNKADISIHADVPNPVKSNP